MKLLNHFIGYLFLGLLGRAAAWGSRTVDNGDDEGWWLAMMDDDDL